MSVGAQSVTALNDGRLQITHSFIANTFPTLQVTLEVAQHRGNALITTITLQAGSTFQSAPYSLQVLAGDVIIYHFRVVGGTAATVGMTLDATSVQTFLPYPELTDANWFTRGFEGSPGFPAGAPEQQVARSEFVFFYIYEEVIALEITVIRDGRVWLFTHVNNPTELNRKDELKIDCKTGDEVHYRLVQPGSGSAQDTLGFQMHQVYTGADGINVYGSYKVYDV